MKKVNARGKSARIAQSINKKKVKKMINKLDLAILAILIFICAILQINIFVKNRQIENLKSEMAILKNDFLLCDAYLKKQNEAFKALKLKGVVKEPQNIEKIKEIYIKDKNCESELNAYKKLFNSAY